MASQFNLTTPGIIDTIYAQSSWALGFTRQNQRLNATLFYLVTAAVGSNPMDVQQSIAMVMELVRQDRTYWVSKRDSSPVEVNTAYDQAVVLANYVGTKNAVSEWNKMVALGATGYNTAMLAAAIDITRTQLQVP